jgi:hypothetical protein
MAGDREKMGENVKKYLNLGCGLKQFLGAVNVDKFATCNPDIVGDIEQVPWHWAKENEFDGILAHHVFEHCEGDWWPVFVECARVLKIGSQLEIRVPDESSSSALSYRDHHHVFTAHSFHGVQDGNDRIGFRSGTNAWALTLEGSVPFKCVKTYKVPFPRYNWMPHWMIQFCARHLRNFIWEQVYLFEKIGG